MLSHTGTPWAGFIYAFTSEDSYIYYTGRWPRSGRLHGSGSYLHSHALHAESYLIAAAPAALGLAVGPLSLEPAKYCVPKLTSHTYALNNTRLRQVLSAACPDCFDAKLICASRGGTTTCKDWYFTQGDVFTSLSFFGAPKALEKPEVQVSSTLPRPWHHGLAHRTVRPTNKIHAPSSISAAPCLVHAVRGRQGQLPDHVAAVYGADRG
jgi:hypothetical protein|mmetsp:Transcript_9735/g.24979  ORF Transcript_9735/g.24979 Transcript_9735/m.24979 type:complete len:209 (-) Transcript_9735:45-671(-)